MKKTLILLLTFCLAILVCSCSGKNTDKEQEYTSIVKPDFVKEELDEKFGTDEIYIVKTIMKSSDGDMKDLIGNGLCITKTHYQLSDGTWKTDDYSYKYKLIVSGRMHNAAKDSTFHILSNRNDITFDMAWKAFGYSSNSEDYFKLEEAVFVGVE